MYWDPTFIELRRQRIAINRRPQRRELEQRINETHASYALSMARLRRKLYNEAVQGEADASIEGGNDLTQFWAENAKIARAQRVRALIRAQENVDFNTVAIERYYRVEDVQKARARVSFRNRVLEQKWELYALTKRVDAALQYSTSILEKKIGILLLQQKRAMKALVVWAAVK